MFLKLAALVVVSAVAAAGWMSGLGHDSSSPPPASATAAVVQRQAGEQTIQITEADLDRRLSQRLVGHPIGNTPLGTATLESITTQMRGGHLVANGHAKVADATVPVSMTASGGVSDGRAIVVVDDLKAAGMSLPESTRQSVQQTLQAQLDEAVDRQQMKVSAMSIDDHKLTVTGTR